MSSPERLDGRRVRGRRTREAVLTAAVARASVDGLAGLSLGQLAGDLGVSKSGLFAHWPDKEQLQLDVIEQARRQWVEHVSRPALAIPRGARRVIAVHEARLEFYAAGVLPGMCFFHAAYSDFDDRPGAVKARLAEVKAEWLDFLQTVVEQAAETGELSAAVNAEQLAFEIEALGEAVVAHAWMSGFAAAYAHSRRAVRERVAGYCTDPSIRQEILS
ncbi:MAG: TetR/AcrR family transcriptional regulator [Micromonosporaceae bacterium]